MKELNKMVGKAIRVVRVQQGLTQEQLAEAAGIHDKHVGRIERGVQGLTFEYFLKIARGLNIDPAELVRNVVESQRGKEDRETLIQNIHSMLKTQSTGNIKLLQSLLYQLPKAQTDEGNSPAGRKGKKSKR